MTRIRSKNTKPEMLVRKALTNKKIRYRLHVKKLAGQPDIVIPKLKTAIFINGCFWHQHKNCKYSVMPKTNIIYWKPKLERNIEKQTQEVEKLKQEGWKIHVFWECQLKNLELANKKLSKFL